MGKTVKYAKLTADERPLFGAYNAVHATKKDKQRTRRAQKLALKRMMLYDYERRW